MTVNGIKHILTFNTADFTRYAGITVLYPDKLRCRIPECRKPALYANIDETVSPVLITEQLAQRGHSKEAKLDNVPRCGTDCKRRTSCDVRWIWND